MKMKSTQEWVDGLYERIYAGGSRNPAKFDVEALVEQVIAAERARGDQILKEVHEALFTHSRADIHKALVQLRTLKTEDAEKLGCQCWMSLNTGPNGQCENCGKIKLAVER